MDQLARVVWLTSGPTGGLGGRVPVRLLEAFKKRIASDGLSLSDAIRGLLLAYELGEVKISSAVASDTEGTAPQPRPRAK